MKLLYLFFLFAFLLLGNAVFAQKHSEVLTSSIKSESQSYRELSLSEWKKFKNFEKKMKLTQRTKSQQNYQLRAYARDSLQILSVKLMAVKLLDEKKLLDRDIAENTSYYETFLTELRNSDIQPTEYLFLEEKMAFFNQEILQEKLVQIRWLIVGLSALCICLIYVSVRLKIKYRKTTIPELSRQEVTVRNLILQGKTNKEIANELFISLSTVKTHITNIYNKLQISGRKELLQKHTGTST